MRTIVQALTVSLTLLTVTTGSPADEVQSARAQLAVRPAQLRLSRESTAEIDIRLATSEGSPVSGAAIEILARAGSVGIPREVGPGRYRAEYTAPAKRFPQLEILVARDRQRVLGWTTLPLVGAGKVEVETEPGARLELLVAGNRYGPVKSDSRGLALIAFEAPPGATRGQLVARDRRRPESRREIDLGVPLVDPIMLVPSRRELIAGEEDGTWIHAFCVGPEGAPLKEPPPSMVPSRGRIEPPERVSAGWFRARFHPPRHVGEGSIEVRASLATGEKRYDVVVEIGLLPGPPARIGLDAKNDFLKVGGGGGLVLISVFDRLGNPVKDVQLAARAECGRVDPVRPLSAHGYSVIVHPPRDAGDCRKVVLAVSAARPGGEPLVQTHEFLLQRPDSPKRIAPVSPRVIERIVRVPPPPPSRLRTWGWAALGAGAAALLPGVILLALDGKETCSSPEPVRCPEVYDTRTGGIVFSTLGSALLAGGLVLHLLAGREEESTGTPALSLITDGDGFLVGAEFNF